MLKWAFINLMFICLIVPCAEAADAKLLFKSGFEGSVQVVPWSPENHVNRHAIKGTDGDYVWPGDLPGMGYYHNFYYAIADENDFSRYINTAIVTVTGRHDRPTKALYQSVKMDDQDEPALSRNQYTLHQSNVDDFDQMYVRYWIKLQPDLNAVMPNNSWRMLMEWFESGDDYRFNLQILRLWNGGPLIWRLKGQKLFPVKEDDWVEMNDQVEVPVGQWFLLEVFWKHSSEADGRILVKVNQNEIIDRRGPNKIDSELSEFMPFKCYGGTNYYQWIDDLEIWDGLPEVKKPKPPEKVEFFVIDN